MTPLFALFGISYSTPNRLWLLFGVAALIGVYVSLQLNRPKVTAKFTNLALLDSVVTHRDDWKRHVGSALFALGLVGIVLSLAHPHRKMKVPTNRATVVLAIDTSLSMEATDVTPDRIRAAQEAAKLFLDSVPKDMNVGVVAFNGVASIRSEPSKDREAARRAIETLELGERTAIGEGIITSLAAIRTVPPARDGSKVPARIVLMSDGATTSGRSNEEAVAQARKAEVPIDTIAFGTDHGTVEIPDSPTPIPVNVDRTALAKIARDSSGQAFTAASEAQIQDVYKSIGRSIGYRTVRKDVSTWFVGAALIFLIGAAGSTMAWQSRML